MSRFKFKKRNKLFHGNNDELKSFLSSHDFLNDDSLPAMDIKEHNKNFGTEFGAHGF